MLDAGEMLLPASNIQHLASAFLLLIVMPETLVVLGCSQLVTLKSSATGPRTGEAMRELSIIEDGAMLVRGGRILKTGVRHEIEPLIEADYEVLDAHERVVMPGFVDAHAHPVFAGTRAD